MRSEDLAHPTDRSANRKSGASVPRRATAEGPCRSFGQAIPLDRAGASTNRAAGCAPTRRCCGTTLISSSIAATASMPTARSERPSSCRMARHGQTRSRRKNPVSPRSLPIIAATTNTTCSTEFARVQCRRSDLRAVGRSRGRRRLVAGQTRSRLPRSQRAPAGGARPPRVRRIHADARIYGRRRAASTARSRMARWSIFSCSTCAAIVARTSIT